MDNASWAVIANPFAGKGRARTVGPWLHEALRRRGIAATLHWTQQRGDAETLTRQALAQGVTRIVACGGDGTVHDAVNAVMNSEYGPGEVGVGIVPLGRCNDLATALGLLKVREPWDQVLVHAVPRLIDVGRTGDRYFTTVATLGFDSEVAGYIDRDGPPRFIRGTLAYLYGVFVYLVRYRDLSVRLKGDFGEFQGPLFMAATGNTTTYGGRIKIAPSAQVDDGLLDVCLVPSVSRLEVLRVLPRVFSGSHVNHPAVSLKRTRVLRIETQAAVEMWADGEPLCSTPVTVEIVPQGLSVLAPGPTDAGTSAGS